MINTDLKTRHDAVVLYPSCREVPDHEASIHRDIAMRIADLLDVPFEGVFNETRHAGRKCYFVPSDTILTPALKDRLDMHDETDLFGGYADHAFMPTKAITHGLIGTHAARPQGWSEAFSEQVRSATLPGYTAFSPADLREAAKRLWACGRSLRLKPVQATGGRDQQIITDEQALETALARLDAKALGECGVVLEIHLENVATYSVGQIRLPGLTASYVGTQRLTTDNHGTQVYGGSRLQFARGGYENLLKLPLTADLRLAVELAGRYDHAADTCYPGFFASRRNYDVAAGTDMEGRTIMGVLEQSWRIGGASRAEIAALEVLAADPSCSCVWAETMELFGNRDTAPAHAVETFAGEDPALGLIRKYVMVEAYGNEQQQH